MARRTRSQSAVLKLLRFVEERQRVPLEQADEIEFFALEMAAGQECAERNITVPEFGTGSRTPAMKINYFRESLYKYYGNLFGNSQVPAGETECYRICLDIHEDWLVWLRAVAASITVAAPRPVKRRASRAHNIEALEDKLIEHLKSARDHAFRTREIEGVPKLLPRPSQRQLANTLKIGESAVSKCLKDPKAHALRVLWNTALNLEAIITFKTPRRRRSTS